MTKELDEILGPVDPTFPETTNRTPTPRYAETLFDLAKGEHIKDFTVSVTEQELLKIGADAGLKKK